MLSSLIYRFELRLSCEVAGETASGGMEVQRKRHFRTDVMIRGAVAHSIEGTTISIHLWSAVVARVRG